jgi:UDP-glucose 4-epimerase
MRILVTGGAGFIGSHLCERWLAGGHDVVAFDDLSTGSKANLSLLEAHPRFRSVEGSVRAMGRVEELVSDADIVCHLAATVGVRRVLEHPRETFETNMEGTRAVLSAAAQHGVRVLFASSSEVYGRGLRIPFSEDDPLLIGTTDEPRWVYAFSKAAGEALGFACARESGLRFLVVRLFNTVGPRQIGRYGMVLPRFVRQAVAGEPITVYGDGTQTRCFIDVRDTARALVSLASSEEFYGRVFNIGGDNELTIDTLAHLVRRIAGSDSPVVHMPYREAYGTEMSDLQRRRPDVTHLRESIGEPVRIGLEQTIAELVEAACCEVAG